jgi:colanic acid/amylovoran biosynthesis glycosyltransferase
MKVLHYCNFFSPVSQTFIYDVVLQLDLMGVENIVVANKLVNNSDRPYANKLELPSIKQDIFGKVKHKLLNRLGLKGHDWETLNDQAKTACLKKVIVSQKPDLVHAHFGPQGYLAFPATQSLGVKLVVSFHGFDAFRLPNEKGWKARLLQLFKSAALVTVVSNLMKNHLITLGCPPEKLSVIHVGKKLDHYPFKQRGTDGIKNFISIGRLTEKKGHIDCVEAFLQLKNSHPELTLKIIGEGELLEPLQNFVHTNNLSERIKLLGGVSHKETINHLESADAFILCSKTAENGDQEGIPTVLMESQALGLPSISTLHSGIPEAFPMENQWLLAEENNVSSIAAKIDALVNADKALVENTIKLGRQKVMAEFNLETEVNKLKKLYQGLL